MPTPFGRMLVSPPSIPPGYSTFEREIGIEGYSKKRGQLFGEQDSTIIAELKVSETSIPGANLKVINFTDSLINYERVSEDVTRIVISETPSRSRR